ncbi:MAG: hypothetical protein ACK4MT_07660, partial [Thermaurantiacus tibetensis]
CVTASSPLHARSRSVAGRGGVPTIEPAILVVQGRCGTLGKAPAAPEGENDRTGGREEPLRADMAGFDAPPACGGLAVGGSPDGG